MHEQNQSQANPVMSNLCHSVLSDLVHAVELRQYDSGAPVCTADEQVDSWLILLQGTLILEPGDALHAKGNTNYTGRQQAQKAPSEQKVGPAETRINPVNPYNKGGSKNMAKANRKQKVGYGRLASSSNLEGGTDGTKVAGGIRQQLRVGPGCSLNEHALLCPEDGWRAKAR
jgi:hypothetical protein